MTAFAVTDRKLGGIFPACERTTYFFAFLLAEIYYPFKICVINGSDSRYKFADNLIADVTVISRKYLVKSFANMFRVYTISADCIGCGILFKLRF